MLFKTLNVDGLDMAGVERREDNADDDDDAGELLVCIDVVGNWVGVAVAVALSRIGSDKT